jgi:putative colanic acid biosynthesis glycosyltransferase
VNKYIVLQISVEVKSGSIGRIVEQISNIVINKGLESHIAYGRGRKASSSNLIKIGNTLNFLLHVFQTRILGNHLNGSWLVTKILIKKIKLLNPDIIHLHQIHGYYLHIPLFFNFLKSYNRPVVWTFHDNWAFTGHCSFFTYIDCDKWKTQCAVCPLFDRYPKSLFFDNSSNEFNLKKKLFNQLDKLHIVTVSNWLAQNTRFSFLNAKPIVTIFNGVNTKIFFPRYNRETVIEKYGLDTSKKYLIATGTTWIKPKGLEDYSKLSELLPVDIQIILVGINTNIAKSVSNKIICIPRTESQIELAELYSFAEILLCLSYQESFGMPPIEAMSCGTPSIVYNNTALPELITSKTGRVVKSGDIDEVLNVIDEIINLGKSHFYNECVQRVKNEFEIEKTFEKYINLYKQLIITKNNIDE